MADTLQISSFGDIVISAMNGRPILISGSDKFSQDMSEIIAANIPQGAGLQGLVGLVPASPLAMTAVGGQRIRDAANSYKALQQSDLGTPRVPAEILSDVPIITFSESATDQTEYDFFVQFMSLQGTTLAKAGVITPGM